MYRRVVALRVCYYAWICSTQWVVASFFSLGKSWRMNNNKMWWCDARRRIDKVLIKAESAGRHPAAKIWSLPSRGRQVVRIVN